MNYDHIVHAVYNQPWAILPETLAVITDLVRFRAEGGRLTEGEIRERIGVPPGAAMPQPRPAARNEGAVAVLPVFGVISQRMTLLSQMSGGTSIEQIAAAFRQAMADPNVKAIVFDVDSPGGGVSGVEELATEIREARGSKPIVAQANSLMASAAYWIGSAADELVVTPSGEVGSIGVLAAHEDHSGELAQQGVSVTLVSAGKFKAERSSFQPLSAEALAYLEQRVNDYYATFVGAVAKGRGVPVDAVREHFGQGRLVGAKQAVQAGMADRVGTLSQTLARLGVGRNAPRMPAALDGDAVPVAGAAGARRRERERMRLRAY